MTIKSIREKTMLKEVNKDFVEDIIERMTLEQKVGGLFVVDFMGTVITPYTVQMIIFSVALPGDSYTART